jgi:hypothetical protein
MGGYRLTKETDTVAEIVSLKKLQKKDFHFNSTEKRISINEEDSELSFTVKTDNFKERKVRHVIHDGDFIIGDCKYEEYHRVDMDKLINKYIKPFLDNGIGIYFVIGGKEPTKYDDITNMKEFLKMRKSMLKSYTNLPDEDNELLIQKFLQYKKTPFCKDQHFDKEIIASDIFEELIQFHWDNHSERRRITPSMINKTVKTLKSFGIKIIYADREADAECVALYQLCLGSFIVSGDSDMSAMGCNTITDIYPGRTGNDAKVKVVYWQKLEKYFFHMCSEYTDNKDITVLRKYIKDAIALSSADYNYFIYDYALPFYKSLEIVIKHGFHCYLERECEKKKRKYDYEVAESLRNCYDIKEVNLEYLFGKVVDSVYNTRFSSVSVSNYLIDEKKIINIEKQTLSLFNILIGCDDISLIKYLTEWYFQILL